jgi:hypothetical protein
MMRQAKAKEASQITPNQSAQTLELSQYIMPLFQNDTPSSKASNKTDIPA